VGHDKIKRQPTSNTIIVDNDTQKIQWYTTKDNVTFIDKDRMNHDRTVMGGRTNLHSLLWVSRLLRFQVGGSMIPFPRKEI